MTSFLAIPRGLSALAWPDLGLVTGTVTGLGSPSLQVQMLTGPVV